MKIIIGKKEYTLTPQLTASLEAFIEAQTKTVVDEEGVSSEVPKYESIAEVVFSNLKEGLFKNILELHPPQDIIDYKEEIQAQEALIEQKKELFTKIK